MDVCDCGEGAAPDHRQRERPGAGGASFDAGHRGVRRDREGRRERRIEVTEKDAKLVQDISETQKGLSRENRLEALHDALQYKEQAQAMFDLGLLDLETKAKVEGIYWQIARNVVRFFEGMRYIPEEVRDLSNIARRPVPLQFLGVPVAAGPLGARASSSRSCPSTGSTNRRSATPRWWTSPATRTARSTSSSTCRT